MKHQDLRGKPKSGKSHGHGSYNIDYIKEWYKEKTREEEKFGYNDLIISHTENPQTHYIYSLCIKALAHKHKVA